MEHNLSIMVMGELLHKHNILTSYYDFDPKVLRFEPPLIVTAEQIDKAVDALDKVVRGGSRRSRCLSGRRPSGACCATESFGAKR